MNQPIGGEASLASFARLQLFIDGAWTDGSGTVREPVINPATGETLGTLPHASKRDLQAAINAADKAFTTWSATPAVDRRRILMEAARLLRERSALISRIITLEEGKPLAESAAELGAAIDIFEWYAEETRRLYGRVIPGRSCSVTQIVHNEPVGPVAAFTPWNFPALTPARKIAGALAAGCSLIIKPAEETPATCIELVRACADAGLPPGVLNIVFGAPAAVSEYLVASPVIRKITFTGSIPVGKHLAQLSARHGLKRCTLELGGHAPVLVFDDANVERAAEICAAGRFRNAGQVCVAPSRFYVQSSAYEQFTRRFVECAQTLVLGDGLDTRTTMGPLASQRRLEAMERLMDGVIAGARLLAGGARVDRPGFFWAPTVLADVSDDALPMQEEIFGPIAPITPFDSLQEGLTRANALPFGLAAFAFTSSPGTIETVSRGLSAGMVGINHLAVSLAEAPFGGMKESGYGSEGGTEGLSAYQVTKFVTHLST